MGTSATIDRGRRVTWTRVLAWCVLGIGLVVAVTSATFRYQVVEDRETSTTRATAANVQTIVATQLARQDDLLDTLAGVVSAVPGMTNAQFEQWDLTARIPERFPGGLGVVYIERVPASRLASFTATETADPITGLGATSDFVVVHTREAAEYCLTRLGV